MRILVLGYYFSHNLGDDAFQVALPLVIGNQHRHVFKFVSIDQMKLLDNVDLNANFDIILLGAGDVVTPYFFRRVNPYVQRFTRGPYMLIGAGLTYESCVQLGHLDQFDRVFLRNTTDLRLAERRLGTMSAHYIPDIVFALDPVPITPKADKPRLQAAFYLIQSIDVDKPSNPARQTHVLQQLARCVDFVSQTHDVTLLRFNTSRTRGGDDIHISTTVAKLVGKPDCVFVDSNAYATPESMLKRMGDFDVNVCMRFHAHVFSVIQQVPFVSLTLTRKVTMLMNELGLAGECGVALPYDLETLQPLDVPYEDFCQKFRYTVEHSDQLKTKLKQLYSQRHDLLLSGVYGRIIENHVTSSNPIRPGRQLFTTFDEIVYTNPQDKSLIDSLVEKADKWWKLAMGFSLIQGEEAAKIAALRKNETLLAESAGNRSIVPHGTEKKVRKAMLYNQRARSDKSVQQRVQSICERISFAITDQVQSSFLYGFIENMLDEPFKIRDYIEWMVKEKRKQAATTEQSNLFNLDFTQQLDFSGSHRSGWSFVVAHLRALHSDKGVILDTCMDRTFHWGCDVLKNAGLLPFTHSWCGIVHHTPLESYSDYNTAAMMRNPAFLASLATCQGIYVLSDALRKWFIDAFAAAGITSPPRICTLIHPTEFCPEEQRFSLERFDANQDKKLINIGAWLRDTFALFRVGLLDSASRQLDGEQNFKLDSRGFIEQQKRIRRINTLVRYPLRRCILHGPNMSLYMPPPPEKVKLIVVGNHGTNSESCTPINQGCRHGKHSRSSSSSLDSSSDDGSNECNQKKKKHRIAVDGESSCGASDGCMTQDENTCSTTASLIHAHATAFESKTRNKWIAGLDQLIDEDVYKSVDVLQRLSNAEYDALLQENIVFLKLFDASACNTLIECIARDTPILINRLPAVEEVLGSDYPFFYDSLSDALQKSRSYATMVAAHQHIKNLRKAKFSIESFIDQVKASEIYKAIRDKNNSIANK